MLQIQVKKFRAVYRADILLDGITVMAGENGCGKSTISKLVYHTLYSANHFDEIEKLDQEQQIQLAAFNALNATQDFLYALKSFKVEIKIPAVSSYSGFDPVDYLNQMRQRITELPQEILSNPDITKQLGRYAAALNKISSQPDDKQGLITEALQSLISFFQKKDEEYKNACQQRPLDHFYTRIRDVFDEDLSPESFDLKEQDVSIFNQTEKRLSTPFDIKDVFYVDTPWIIDPQVGKLFEDDIHVFHRHTLYQALIHAKEPARQPDLISKEISDITNGSSGIRREKFGWRLVFTRKDGKLFTLFHCATGIKSFAILQILYSTGLLDKNMLLILDEPEAHLHPKWIVEYARLIVELWKQCGVRFLISSHSPDMVAAIQAIAQKEGAREHTHFYLAKETEEGSFEYDYTDLGFSVDKIFESFNKSMEGITRYGADVE